MKYSRLSIFLLIILVICFTAPDCIAKEDNSKKQSVIPEKAVKQEPELIQKMDKAHKKISGYILNSAAWLDSFFSDERYEAEDNHSRLKVRFSTFLEDGEDIEFKSRLNLRIILNQLSEKFNFIISGNPDDDLDSDLTSETNINKNFAEKNNEEENFVFALQYFLQSTRKNNFKMQGGVRLGHYTPVLWGGPRFRWLFENKAWAYRFTQQIRWFTDEGWYVNSSFDCERPLTDKFFFRTTAGGLWNQEEEGYKYSVNCNIYQALSHNRALEYHFGNIYETSPASQLEEVVFSVSYRQNIWKEWITLDISPQVSFPRDNDFDFTPGIRFAFEGRFGWNP